jgi:hypothetical protein
MFQAHTTLQMSTHGGFDCLGTLVPVSAGRVTQSKCSTTIICYYQFCISRGLYVTFASVIWYGLVHYVCQLSLLYWCVN